MVQERTEHLPSLRKGYFFILLLVVFDMSSKYLAKQYLEFGEMVPMIPSLDLLLVFNSGVAFSMLDFNNAFTSYGLLIIGFILVGYLYSMITTPDGKKMEQVQKFSWVFVKKGQKWQVVTDFDLMQAPLTVLDDLKTERIVTP